MAKPQTCYNFLFSNENEFAKTVIKDSNTYLLTFKVFCAFISTSTQAFTPI